MPKVATIQKLWIVIQNEIEKYEKEKKWQNQKKKRYNEKKHKKVCKKKKVHKKYVVHRKNESVHTKENGFLHILKLHKVG